MSHTFVIILALYMIVYYIAILFQQGHKTGPTISLSAQEWQRIYSHTLNNKSNFEKYIKYLEKGSEKKIQL